MGELAGQPNYFVPKILNSLPEYQVGAFFEIGSNDDKFRENGLKGFKGYKVFYRHELHPKIHTIRLDPHDRWRPGVKIHFVINNRTKNRFQFAPVLECVSVQKIEIKWRSLIEPAIWIDGHLLDDDEKTELAENDGFPSFSEFMNFFNQDFTGKIIHWTDLKY